MYGLFLGLIRGKVAHNQGASSGLLRFEQGKRKIPKKWKRAKCLFPRINLVVFGCFKQQPIIFRRSPEKPIAGLVHSTILDGIDNNFSGNLSPLSNLVKLTELNLEGNRIVGTLNPLENLVEWWTSTFRIPR